MPARTLLLLAALSGVIVLAAACGQGDLTKEGVILDVQSNSLTEVESFTLLVEGGDVLTFKVAPDAAKDPEEGFSPGHLREHALASQRVKVTYREEDGERLALSLTHS